MYVPRKINIVKKTILLGETSEIAWAIKDTMTLKQHIKFGGTFEAVLRVYMYGI